MSRIDCTPGHPLGRPRVPGASPICSSSLLRLFADPASAQPRGASKWGRHTKLCIVTCEVVNKKEEDFIEDEDETLLEEVEIED